MNLALLVLALATRTVFSFADPAIDESSGLVDLGSVMVTTNDSGDDAVLYLVDPRTGRTVGHTRYAAGVEDVEALAPGADGTVWVGDIGDNRHRRPHVTVYRVPVGAGETSLTAPAYRLGYPDGPRDAESMVVIGGRVHVISKGVLGGRVYAAPRMLRTDRVNRLRPVGRVGLFATDAALFRDGRHVLVRGYGTAEVRTVPGFTLVARFDLPLQQQGEAVSIGPGGRIRLSSEGAGSAVLEIGLPDRVRAAMAPPEDTPEDPSAASGHASGPAGADPSSAPGRWTIAAVVAIVVAGLGYGAARRRRR